MFQSIRHHLNEQLAKLRSRFGQVKELPLGDVVPLEVVEQVVQETVGPYRNRVFPPLVTLSTFIQQVLTPDQSCQAAVDRVVVERVAQGQAPCSSDTGAYCKARDRLPEALIERLVQTTGQALEAQAKVVWQWRGRTVKLVDGTTVTLPDTPANQAEYPQATSQASGVGLPQARLVGVLSLATGAVHGVASGPCQGKQTGEHALLRQLTDHLVAGEVVLGDGYYSSYWLLAELQSRGVDGVFPLHGSRHSGLRAGQEEAVVTWDKPKQRPAWMEEATYQRLPATLTVREIRARKYLLVTTLVDAKAYPRKAILRLYKQRWHVEIDLKFIKEVMQMGQLRCKTPALVRKEIAVHLLAYNLVRLVMAQAAKRYSRAPCTLSLSGALHALTAFQARGLLDTGQPLSTRYEHLFRSLIRHRIGNRPGRVEPRAVKRRPSKYPFLTKPRQQARDELLQNLQYA